MEDKMRHPSVFHLTTHMGISDRNRPSNIKEENVSPVKIDLKKINKSNNSINMSTDQFWKASTNDLTNVIGFTKSQNDNKIMKLDDTTGKITNTLNDTFYDKSEEKFEQEHQRDQADLETALLYRKSKSLRNEERGKDFTYW